ncbi:MAG: BufA1 family periplasmic bufferin-type metallophore [Steroidobacteraceae bacterium]
MSRRLFAASALSTAVGLVLAMQVVPVQAGMKTQHLQKCFGINAVAKNDCAAGAHSCAGQATKARDPKSYVLLPAGDCSKIAGGSLKPT